MNSMVERTISAVSNKVTTTAEA
jgi:GTPase